VALLDSDHDHGSGNVLARPQTRDRLSELTARLHGVHPDPAIAAQRLLAGFSPIVSIDRARHGAPSQPQASRENWTIGIAFARWLVRVGLQTPPAQETPRALASPLRDDVLNSMRDLETERMVAIFADAQGRMISQDLVAEGKKGQLRLSLRRIFTKALARDARRMVLAHNHPSGSAEPSENDITSTLRLQSYAHSLGIALEDHLIIGRDSITSMRSLGLL
jgi:DNA repair protein RadC